MRQDTAGFDTLNRNISKEPRYVVEVSFDAGNTDLHYFTSHADAALPDGAVAILDTVKYISGTSQHVKPEKALATIGTLSFTLVNIGDAVGALQYNKLQLGFGLKGKRVRVYVGYKDLAWADYSLVTTQIIETVSAIDNDYKFVCSDVQREERKDIFDLAETNLSQSLLVGETTVNVYSTAAFTPVAHSSSFTDAPDESVIYFKVENEVIRAPASGVTATEFTNCIRGALNTAEADHIIDANTPAERRTEVTEHIYLELPAPKLMYALLTGTLLGQGEETLPDTWNLGIDPIYVRQTDFTGIGEDLYDTTNESAGLTLRFEGLKKQDGKRFIEKELLLLMGTFSPVYTDGALGLRRMTSVLSKAGYVYELDESNVSGYGELLADMKAIHNHIEIDWNWLDTKEKFTRHNVLIDQESINIHGETNPLKFSFRGLHGSIHSAEKLGERFNAFRDRYTGPPLRLNLTCLPSTNVLEVGDTVRVNLPQLDDYNAGEKLNRTFEVQNVSIDWITGAVRLTLFGSSQAATAINYSIVSSCVMPRSYYVSEGFNLATDVDAGNYDPAQHYENIGGVGHLKVGTPTLTHDWATVVNASAPSAWYRFNEDPATGVCADETATYNGTYVGTLTSVTGLVEGDVSKAVKTTNNDSGSDGSGYVTLPNSLDAIVRTSSFTIEAVFQKSHQDKFVLISRSLGRRSGIEYGLQVQVDDHYMFVSAQVGAGFPTVHRFEVQHTIDAEKTYHVAFTRNISTGRVECYLNGTLLKGATVNTGSLAYSSFGDRGYTVLAKRWYTVTERYTATISELVFYNRVLPDTEILNHANHSGANDYLSAHPMLIGGSDMTAAPSIFYHDGDLVIDAGVICRIKDNVQLRVRGHLQINGKIDGVGAGHVGAAYRYEDRSGISNPYVYSPYRWRKDNKDFGTEGFIGPTKTGGGIYSPYRASRFDSYDGWVTPGQNLVAPDLTFEYVDGAVVGIPTDARGTSGATGRMSSEPVSGNYWHYNYAGGSGGNGGAGLCITSQGCNFGAAGEIDVSGSAGRRGDHGGGGSSYFYFDVNNENHLMAGSGAGGAPGAVYFMIDGSSSPTPLLDYVTACFGRTPICGVPLPRPSQGFTTLPRPIYSYYLGIDGCPMADLSGYNGAARISFIIGCETAEPDPILPPPDVTGFNANAVGSSVVLNWNPVTIADLAGYEIRYIPQLSGDAYEEGVLGIQINGTNTNVTLDTIPDGQWTFLIKAINSSGLYSVNPAAADATTTSDYVNQITTPDEYPRWKGTLTQMVKLWNNVLVPDSVQTMDNYNTWSQFETANPEPYADAYYEIAAPIDIGFDAQVRIWSQITSRLMPGEVAGVKDPVGLQIDGRTAAGSYVGFSSWVIGEAFVRYVKMRVHVDTGLGIPYIKGMVNYIDAKSRAETGVQVVGATGTTITFTNQFFSAPLVTADPQGTTPLTVMRSNITATSFDAHVFDSSGTEVGGTIDWTATGV